MKTHRKRLLIIVAILLSTAIIAVVAYFAARPSTEQSNVVEQPKTPIPTDAQPATTESPESLYLGTDATFADTVSVRVPNGWRASVSSNPSFLAVQFARPGEIASLTYQASAVPAIDYAGIPAWDGLMEHFYIRKITTSSQAFAPSVHREVASEPFTFEDGTAGTKYSVTKHADEAKAYGGLLKDNEWYGRVYVYKKGDTTVEAHLAYYPSTQIDAVFFEKVARSIQVKG